jgi:prepilin-type N-terminal cleavage/methylation domain-containing protein
MKKLTVFLKHTITASRLKKVNGEKGYSLIEVLVSIVMLSVIVAAIGLALSTTSKTLVHTDLNQKARNFAEQEMESLVYPVSNSAQTGTGFYAGLTATITATTITPTTGSIMEQAVNVTVTGSNIPAYTITDYKVQ